MTTGFRALALALTILAATPAAGDSDPPPPAAPEAVAGSLEGFARLVGGRWKMGDVTLVYEWGIGRRTVLARSFDEWGRQLAEVRWFYHPGRRQIVGYSIDAEGEDFGEMILRFEGDVVLNELRTLLPSGKAGREFSSRWVFTDADHFEWTLFAHRGGRRLQQVTATAERLPPPAAAPAAPAEGG